MPTIEVEGTQWPSLVRCDMVFTQRYRGTSWTQAIAQGVKKKKNTAM
jgi:hypothetical protein